MPSLICQPAIREKAWAYFGAVLFVAGTLGVFSAARAQSIGEVEFARGVGFAQSEGQGPRTLGKGLALKQGDRLTTAEGGSAIVALRDGTRMTVRPNSEMVIQQYNFRENAPDNNMVMQLLRGGFRAITGLISKNAPNAARVVTRTATLGIRGTDFDARICSSDCKGESTQVSEKPRENAVQASAKLVSALGEINALDSGGVRRRVVPGGSVYPGDVVETGASASAVLAFRDNSRLTLGPATRFRVDSFVFDAQNPKEGRFLVSLLRGSLRALTGLIGKANTRNVSFTTPTATIGIRGTGLDIDCATDIGATETGCSLFTWLGSIEVTPNGQTALQVLQTGQGLFVGSNEIRPLGGPTLQNLPRPDGVTVDFKQLFGEGAVDDSQEGLFVLVRDGHIEVISGQHALHLGRGETGFAGVDGILVRPTLTPLFLEFDRTPMPNSRNPMLATMFGESRIGPIKQCR